MKTVCVGVRIHSDPQQFAAALAGLHGQTSESASLLLLPDGLDLSATEALRKLCDAPQLASTEPRGGAACFNQLAQAGNADVIVLLESGCLVGPGWLDRLLVGLEADSRNGLAGPSTNRSWNEQAACPGADGTPVGVGRAAEEVARRFGDAVRTLEPLYSLADFCYAVRREVIEDAGPADEGYGLGPCWEMDYNIRAARAGWRGVWACGAYVWRAPMTARRQREEAQLFESSKRRYQDKFCGARLRGLKHDYRAHCRGDACPNFAPLEFKARSRPTVHEPGAKARPAPVDSPSQTAKSFAVSGPVAPLVSCIMPTCNRRPFIAGAIRNFLNQDYPNLELLIVDDGADSVKDLAPTDPRVRYLRLDQKRILGDKRNFACQEARGDFIAHWDDDDWYPPNRVSRQMSGLLSSGADICGTSALYYCDTARQRAWLYTYSGGSRGWVGGNTLAYTRAFWQRAPFPNLQVGEDTRFVWADRSARICNLNDPTLCVARIHPGNTCLKAPSGSCWRSIAISEIQRVLGQALDDFQLAAAGRPSVNSGTGDRPLVSCIMPTANRRDFVRLALRFFQQQDYPNKELIIVDDGQQDVSDLVSEPARVTYLRLPSRVSIGAKRNLACLEARGSIIAHWDDDDWYAPSRLSFQITPLIQNEADITGLDSRYVLELASGQCWTISPALHQRMFVGNIHGGTLVFRKTIFDHGVRYPDVNVAEDAALLRAAIRLGKRLVRLPNPELFVYVRHGTNAWKFASGRFLDSAGWQSIAAPTAFLLHLNDYKCCTTHGSSIAKAPCGQLE